MFIYIVFWRQLQRPNKTNVKSIRIAMSRQRGHRSARKENNHFGRAAEAASTFDADNPVLNLFRAAATELDSRHDRYERLIKISRDITIESKRIIFLLHSAIKEADRNTAITEAGKRLEALRNGIIQKAAKELTDSPLHLNNNALSPGLQEYVEAITLYGWLLNGIIPNHKELEGQFQFTIDETGKDNESTTTRVVALPLPATDYILGLADLTGELMRRCINVLTSGDTEECSTICQLVRNLHTGFLGIGGARYEVSRKMYTMRNNVSKVESVVYAICVRGGEAPPSLLLPASAPQKEGFSANTESDDEGFF